MWIYPEQLFTELNKEFKSVYVLLGNDSYLLQDSYRSIIKIAKSLNFNEHIHVELDMHTNWNDIFNLLKISNLFEKQKILLLKFHQNYHFGNFEKKISLLLPYLNIDLVLIIYIYIPNQIHIHNMWLQYFKEKGIFVDCSILTYTRLKTWIKNKAKHMELIIDDLTCQLLCYSCEGNLMALHQTLKVLSLIYPNGNLKFIHVKKIITDLACFNINHWIEAVLIGNKHRADRILNQLNYMNTDLEILFRKIKYTMLMIINIKYAIKNQKSLFSLLQKYKIYKKYHYMLLSRAVKRLDLNQLHQTIELLAQTELKYKTEHIILSKSIFETLSTILCK